MNAGELSVRARGAHFQATSVHVSLSLRVVHCGHCRASVEVVLHRDVVFESVPLIVRECKR
jgi:hypothetical protein